MLYVARNSNNMHSGLGLMYPCTQIQLILLYSLSVRFSEIFVIGFTWAKHMGPFLSSHAQVCHNGNDNEEEWKCEMPWHVHITVACDKKYKTFVSENGRWKGGCKFLKYLTSGYGLKATDQLNRQKATKSDKWHH